MNTRIAVATLAFSWMLAGCPKADSTNKPTPRGESDLRLVLVPEADEYNPWDEGTVRLVLHNDGEEPVFVLHARIRTGLEQAALDADTTRRLPAEPKGDDQHITGRFLVEELENPAVARLPMPPRWELDGERKLVTAAVLPPGGRMDWQGRFRARYEAEPELVGEVEYVRPPRTVKVYELDDVESKRLDSPEKSNDPPFVIVEKLELVYRERDSGSELSESLTTKMVSSHPGVDVYKYAITDVGLAASTTEKIHAQTPLHVARLDYDITDARVACKMPHGPYTYLLGAETWVVSSDTDTCFATAQEAVTVPGQWIPLADTLNDERKTDVTLFTYSSHPDPDGHLGYFKQMGFQVKQELQKGMTHNGSVVVSRAQLPEFAVAYTKRDLPPMK